MLKGYAKWICWCALCLLPACGGGNLDRPEDVVTRIRLDYSSVLGYARFAVDSLPQGDFLYSGPAEEAPAVPQGSLYPLAELIVPCCRPGSHLVVAIIDGTVFGGPVAIRFEPIRAGALEAALDRDPRFERIPGSAPPEYERIVEKSFHDQLAGLLSVMGLTGPWGGLLGVNRFIVENTSLGTLIMPTFDVRGDFVRFLEETGCLEPWGEAEVVVNLEILRLLMAHADLIEAWDRSYRSFLSRIEQALGDRCEEYAPLFRFARFLPAITLEGMKAIEGIQYVSRAPGSERSELRIETAPGSWPADFLSALREDALDLPGLVPAGMALQWNIDPAEMGRLLKRALAFYAEESDLDAEFTARHGRTLLTMLAGDSGRYLLGLGGSFEGGYAALVSAREAGDAGITAMSEAAGSRAEKLINALFPDLLPTIKPLAGPVIGQRIENPWPLPGMLGLPAIAVESGHVAGLDIATLQVGPGFAQGNLIAKLNRLHRMGMGRLRSMPERAPLAVSFVIPALFLTFVPGIEKLIPDEIMGIGHVDGHRLTIRFGSDRP